MTRDAFVQVNALLEQFYAANGAAADAVLEKLVACVRLSVSELLSQKEDVRDDLEDLCGETIGRFVQALRQSHGSVGQRIHDCIGYARTIARNVFNDHMRAHRPAWYRLKRRLLYLLDDKRSDDLFARWQLGSEWLGGFARWRGQPFRVTKRYQGFVADHTPFRESALHHQDPAQIQLPELMAHLFRWLDTPLELDDLTTHLAALQHLSEPTTVSIEGLAEESEHQRDDVLPSASVNVEEEVVNALAHERFRAQLWREICDLPPRQRAALLLGMERDDLLLLAETVTRIADALTAPLSEFADVWRVLPVSDEVVAERLEVTLLQVSNLRKCARERLARRMSKMEKWSDGEMG